MNKFAVLVASSDSRKDIFDICFAHSSRIWLGCDWPRYVGLTTLHKHTFGFNIVLSDKQEWREAVTDYVNALPKEVEYILLMVEDALFMKPVDVVQLNEIAQCMLTEKHMNYVRLVPLRRNWYERFRLRRNKLPRIPIGGNQWLNFIPADEPYYSSTEMTIWKREYLLQLLAIPGNVWDFELFVFDNKIHWATSSPVFDQHQIVQKGTWSGLAPKYLSRAMPRLSKRQWKKLLLKGNRPFQTRKAQWRGRRENLSFALFGFSSFRIKRWLRDKSQA